MRRRIKQVNGLIKKTISNLFLKEINFPKDTLVTITQVKTSSDLGKASVFISVIPEEKSELVFRILEKTVYQLQQKLNKTLVMKKVPKIVFEKETKTAEADRIERILDELKNKGKTDNIRGEE